MLCMACCDKVPAVLAGSAGSPCTTISCHHQQYLALCLQATIIANLKDTDVSIRRRALDLLFTMCDGGSAVEVVEELVSSNDASRHCMYSQIAPYLVATDKCDHAPGMCLALCWGREGCGW